MPETPAHDQSVVNRYVIHYPAHEPRETDPHYAAFNAYHRSHRPTARCDRGSRLGFADCADAQGHPLTIDDKGQQSGLELHHRFVEFSLQNAVSLDAVRALFPDVTDEAALQAFVESDRNFVWLCAKCHRGHGGVHHASAADWEGEQFIVGLID